MCSRSTGHTNKISEPAVRRVRLRARVPEHRNIEAFHLDGKGTDCSAGETVAGIVPLALVVKAIPPFAELLEQPPETSGKMRSSVFICGDNAEAKTTVSALVSELGADPVDAGPLTSARFTEPLGMLLVRLAYAQGFGGRIGAALVRYS